MKTKTALTRNSVSPSLLWRGLLLMVLVLAWIGPSPSAQAVNPPPDGGYPNLNTAEGTDALFSLTTGSGNTAAGFDTLYDNTTGSLNTAAGANALFSNTTGVENTAIGFDALNINTTGNHNTATGVFVLGINSTGNNNTADGFGALFHNTTGNSNTAIGRHALFKNTIGDENIALGVSAGSALTIGNNNIDIGNGGLAGEADTIRIGATGTQTNTYMAGISGVTVAGGVGVIVDANGHLGTVVSSERFKDSINPMDKASEAILALKPVAFRYKPELDPEGIPQFGLVAEQVEKVDPDLVACDDKGKPYAVRYEAVNAMLLNEFLKEHRTVEELKKEIAALTATVKEQTSQIQKVTAELQTSKPAPHMVVNKIVRRLP
jgi:Chaperone of endosialidase